MILNDEQLAAFVGTRPSKIERDLLDTVSDLKRQLAEQDSWYMSRMCSSCRTWAEKYPMPEGYSIDALSEKRVAEALRRISDALEGGVTRYSRDRGEPEPTPAYAIEVVFSMSDWNKVLRSIWTVSRQVVELARAIPKPQPEKP